MLPLGTHRVWVFMVLLLLCSIHARTLTPWNGFQQTPSLKDFKVVMEWCKFLSWREKRQAVLAAPIQPGSEQSAEAPSKPNMTMKAVYGSFLSFFRPMTCRLSSERPLTPCPVEGLNMSECSKIGCCPFRIGQDEQCYLPVRDDVQLAIRVILLAGGGFLTLGFLPVVCCAFLQRCPCINPLRKISKKVQKVAREKKARDEEIHQHLLD